MKTNIDKHIGEIQSLIAVARSITHAVMLTASPDTGEDTLHVTQLCYAAECAGKADELIRNINNSQLRIDTWQHVDNATSLIYLLASAFDKNMSLRMAIPMFHHIDELLNTAAFNIESGVAA